MAGLPLGFLQQRAGWRGVFLLTACISAASALATLKAESERMANMHTVHLRSETQAKASSKRKRGGLGLAEAFEYLEYCARMQTPSGWGREVEKFSFVNLK